MIDYNPPPVGPDWTPAERLDYIAWLARAVLHRIDLDDPTVPLLAKRPVRDLFHAVYAVAGRQAEALERDRAALLKPIDPAGAYNSVEVPAEWLAALAALDTQPRKDADR